MRENRCFNEVGKWKPAEFYLWRCGKQDCGGFEMMYKDIMRENTCFNEVHIFCLYRSVDPLNPDIHTWLSFYSLGGDFANNVAYCCSLKSCSPPAHPPTPPLCSCCFFSVFFFQLQQIFLKEIVGGEHQMFIFVVVVVLMALCSTATCSSVWRAFLSSNVGASSF